MKLLVPHEYNGEVRDANGSACKVMNGVVEIPDNLVHDGLWALGFVREVPKPQASAKSTEAKE